jgi:molybdopterin synthase catalytic subunit
MFRLSKTPLDPAAYRAAILRVSAGALVVFEGNVREENAGRPVTRLEYEGAEELAGKAFAAIEAEVRQQFDVLDVHCIHRVGNLAIGESAVWIGVVAAHRDAAFRACRYTIDELKKRVPVWKKEHYADGDSGWLESP